MKQLIILAFLPIILFAFQPKSTVKKSQLNPLLGNWNGSLTYLDYSSNKPVTIPANISINKIDNNSHAFQIVMQYPDEPKANSTDTFAVTANGQELDGYAILSNSYKNGKRIIVAIKKGIDGNDNKPAMLKKTYTIEANFFSIEKAVQFDGTTDWIQRNKYQFTKIKT